MVRWAFHTATAGFATKIEATAGGPARLNTSYAFLWSLVEAEALEGPAGAGGQVRPPKCGSGAWVGFLEPTGPDQRPVVPEKPPFP